VAVEEEDDTFVFVAIESST